MTVIVDTNVILVANGHHEAVSAHCVSECAKQLQAITQTGRLALDDAFMILREYQNKTQANRAKGPGDAFVKWALRISMNPQRCDRVPIAEHASRGFESFPDDSRLAQFGAADRKFVAVSIAHADHPPILQATDSKWLNWASTLSDYGVNLELLCPDDIKRFHFGKSGT